MHPKTILYLQEHIPALIPSCRALTRIPLIVVPDSGTRTNFKNIFQNFFKLSGKGLTHFENILYGYKKLV